MISNSSKVLDKQQPIWDDFFLFLILRLEFLIRFFKNIILKRYLHNKFLIKAIFRILRFNKKIIETKLFIGLNLGSIKISYFYEIGRNSQGSSEDKLGVPRCHFRWPFSNAFLRSECSLGFLPVICCRASIEMEPSWV